MTLRELQLLNENQQAEVILGADFVAMRSDEQHNVLLYHLSDFYIEIYFCKNVLNILKIRAFKNTYALVPYFKRKEIFDLGRFTS